MTYKNFYKRRDGHLGESHAVARTLTLRISRERKRKAHELASHFRISLSRLVEKLLDDYTNSN